jgi:hypothetical protein
LRTLIPPLAAAIALVFAGCGREPAPEPAPATEARPAPTAVQPAPGGEIQLAGTLGCGHCSFHATNECAAVMKTDSGELYVLDGVDEKSELWEKRLEPGHKITVAGKVVGNEPLKHVAMTSFELE